VSTSGLTTWSQFSVQVFHAPVLLPRRNDACKSSKVAQLGNEVRSACAQDERRAVSQMNKSLTSSCLASWFALENTSPL
jgi:hypothetical protein